MNFWLILPEFHEKFGVNSLKTSRSISTVQKITLIISDTKIACTFVSDQTCIKCSLDFLRHATIENLQCCRVRKKFSARTSCSHLVYTHTHTHTHDNFFLYICYLTDLAVLIKYTRVPLSCDTIWSIHPMLDTRTVHIILCIHHLLFLFNNNTNSLLLRRLLWDWLVASQERWVCTKLPMYVLSTFLLSFHNCRTTLHYRGRDTHRKVEICVSKQRNVESNHWGASRFLNIAPQIFDFSFFIYFIMWRQRGVMKITHKSMIMILHLNCSTEFCMWKFIFINICYKYISN